MFRLESTFKQVTTMPKYIDGVPVQFYTTKEEMENEVMELYANSDMTWDELLDEIEMIEDMFEETDGL